MGFIQDFKAFAMKGNVIDMAVGVIIGGAFGKIVTSLVNDIIMPLVGLLMGGIDFKTAKIVLKEAVMNGEEIITTPSHPFYSPVKGWTDAAQLRAGDI